MNPINDDDRIKWKMETQAGSDLSDLINGGATTNITHSSLITHLISSLTPGGDLGFFFFSFSRREKREVVFSSAA